MTDIDITIVQVPRIAPVRPSSAPAVLKAMCNSVKKTSKVVDFNREFYLDYTKTNPDIARQIDEYWIAMTVQLSQETKNLYDQLIQSWIDRLLQIKSKIIAVCVFSWQSHRFVRDFLERLRPQYSGEILIGGQGLSLHQHMSSHQTPATYAQELLNDGLVNWYLKGETEETFPRFLLGERDLPGLNNDFNTQPDVNLTPYGDFSDVDITSYQNGFTGGVLPLETSRGCIRNCAFCDQSTPYGVLRHKDGVSVAKELLHYYSTYGVKNFYFHDYVINANLVELHKFLDFLLDFYKENGLPDRYFTFSGYWIIRSRKEFAEPEFEKLYRAGANTLVTGVETGSDKLRTKMRKGFLNKDLEFNINQINHFRLKFYFMLIAGLPGETLDDFNQTLDMLTRWQKYVASGSIIGVNLGTTTTIEPGTHIHKHAKKFKIIGLKGREPEGINWLSLETPELDYKERARRRVAMQEHVMKLGYPMWKGDDHLKIMVDVYKSNIEVWEG